LYLYCLSDFLEYCKLDLGKFLKLEPQKITDLIIDYLIQKKVGKQYKNLITSALTHACKMNDVLLDWDKIKKFTKSAKTGNELSSKSAGYTHEDIQQILQMSDQRIKTCFLILASTGIRIGSLGLLKVGDLERIKDLYKVVVYSGSHEEYITFCTPECANEIDAYLEFRKRRGEHITSNSYLIVKLAAKSTAKGEPFRGRSLSAVLENYLNDSGVRQINHDNQYKRKDIPLLHGFRRFTMKQFVDSKINPEIREMLMGHKIGLASAYYHPTEQEMLNEYLKAVPLLTISNEERLRFKLEERITIERTQLETLKADFEKFKQEVLKRRK